MAHTDDPLVPAVQTAHVWVRAVADSLDTDDRAFAYRALRAWMHTVRDRIGVSSSAHLSAQLPELLRGAYYEGWVPSHVPVRHDLSAFIIQFARESGIDPEEVGPVAGAVTMALAELFSPGQLNRMFAVLPMHLHGVLCGARTKVSELKPDGGAVEKPDRLGVLEQRVGALADAVAALAHGLERLPVERYDENRMNSAAQEAHRILLTEGLVPTRGQER